MRLIPDNENPLTDSDAENQAELHMQPGDTVTIIDPRGNEIYVYAHEVDGELTIQF